MALDLSQVIFVELDWEVDPAVADVVAAGRDLLDSLTRSAAFHLDPKIHYDAHVLRATLERLAPVPCCPECGREVRSLDAVTREPKRVPLSPTVSVTQAATLERAILGPCRHTIGAGSGFAVASTQASSGARVTRAATREEVEAL